MRNILFFLAIGIFAAQSTATSYSEPWSMLIASGYTENCSGSEAVTWSGSVTNQRRSFQFISTSSWTHLNFDQSYYWNQSGFFGKKEWWSTYAHHNGPYGENNMPPLNSIIHYNAQITVLTRQEDCEGLPGGPGF